MIMGRPHPLDRLLKDDSLFMLEAMIPFVDYNFKKPLIMLIKYQELSAILKCFDNPEYIAECGFDCHPSTSEDMLNSLCNIMPGYGNGMKQAMQMMNMMQSMQNMPNMQNSSTMQDTKNSTMSNTDNWEHLENSCRNYCEDDYSQIDPNVYNNQPKGKRNLYDSVMSILDEEY